MFLNKMLISLIFFLSINSSLYNSCSPPTKPTIDSNKNTNNKQKVLINYYIYSKRIVFLNDSTILRTMVLRITNNSEFYIENVISSFKIKKENCYKTVSDILFNSSLYPGETKYSSYDLPYILNCFDTTLIYINTATEYYYHLDSIILLPINYKSQNEEIKLYSRDSCFVKIFRNKDYISIKLIVPIELSPTCKYDSLIIKSVKIHSKQNLKLLTIYSPPDYFYVYKGHTEYFIYRFLLYFKDDIDYLPIELTFEALDSNIKFSNLFLKLKINEKQY